MEKKPTSSIVAGLLITLVIIAYGLVLYFANQYTNSGLQWIGTGIYAIALILAILNNGKENNHKVTFGNLFAFGFKTVAVITCLMILYTLLQGVVLPDIKTRAMEMAREQAAANPNPNATPEQMEQGFKWFEDHYTFVTLAIILFGFLISGVIASLIGAAVAKKVPKDPF